VELRVVPYFSHSSRVDVKLGKAHGSSLEIWDPIDPLLAPTWALGLGGPIYVYIKRGGWP